MLFFIGGGQVNHTYIYQTNYLDLISEIFLLLKPEEVWIFQYVLCVRSKTHHNYDWSPSYSGCLLYNSCFQTVYFGFTTEKT